MITLYHLSTSRSERIIWLMEELALPYELERFLREPSGAAPDALREIHPLGRAPVIRDGELVLAESGAIVDYIVHRYGADSLAVAPMDSRYARYLYWLHFAEGSLMTLLLVALALTRVPGANASPAGGRVAARMKQMLSFVDAELGEGTWFVGPQFTAADIMMTFPFTTMRLFLEYDLAPFHRIVAYLERIEARLAYRKAMAIAGTKEKS